MHTMKFYPLISITCKTNILPVFMVHCTIRLIPDTLTEENEMAYSLLVKMGAADGGATAVLTAVATVLA